jgi:hypothetical protein
VILCWCCYLATDYDNQRKNGQQLGNVEKDKPEPGKFEDDEFKEEIKALNDQGKDKVTNSF